MIPLDEIESIHSYGFAEDNQTLVVMLDLVGGGTLMVQAEPGTRTRPPVQPDHPLQVFFRSEDRPLSRYEVLVSPRFAGVRDALLREMDEVRAAALIPCRDRRTLRGILLLGAQARGGSSRRGALRRRRADCGGVCARS
jgi:hypothetical protein